jgi:hypothetical protein
MVLSGPLDEVEITKDETAALARHARSNPGWQSGSAMRDADQTTGRLSPAPLGSPAQQRGPFGTDRSVIKEPAPVVSDFLGGGIAVGRVLFQRFEEDRLQFR